MDTQIEELLARDKMSLDIAWLRDESLEDVGNLLPPEVIAQEIVCVPSRDQRAPRG